MLLQRAMSLSSVSFTMASAASLSRRRGTSSEMPGSFQSAGSGLGLVVVVRGRGRGSALYDSNRGGARHVTFLSPASRLGPL